MQHFLKTTTYLSYLSISFKEALDLCKVIIMMNQGTF